MLQREEILTEARAKVLSLVSAEALEADRKEAEERQRLILDDCIRRAENMSMRLWEATRAAAIKWGEIVHYKRCGHLEFNHNPFDSVPTLTTLLNVETTFIP